MDAATHAIIAAEVSLETVADNEVFPSLLNPLRRKIEQVSADGAYDTKACHALLQKKGARPLSHRERMRHCGKRGHPRNEAVTALKAGELAQWKQASGYHQRSKAERQPCTSQAAHRCKAEPVRNYNAQVGEALAWVKLSTG